MSVLALKRGVRRAWRAKSSLPTRLACAFVGLPILGGVGLITAIVMDGPKSLRITLALCTIACSIVAFVSKHEPQSNPIGP